MDNRRQRAESVQSRMSHELRRQGREPIGMLLDDAVRPEMRDWKELFPRLSLPMAKDTSRSNAVLKRSVSSSTSS